MGNPLDLTGQRFGRLTAIELGANRNKRRMWRCVCDCGNEKYVTTSNLRCGITKSCGCLHSDLLASRNYKHGGSSNRLYNVWSNMLSRCYKPYNDRFYCYGGRGIAVCDEWRNNYAAFRDWAMANGYDPDAQYGKCTLDRIDVNGNYEPSNCRWVGMDVQNKNKHDNPSAGRQRDEHGRFLPKLKEVTT